MITNTCLTGGSFELEPPGEELGAASLLGELDVGLLDGLVGVLAAGAGPELSAAGVGSASAARASPPDVEADDSLALGELVAGAPCGSTSFTGCLDAACVPLTGERAT